MTNITRMIPLTRKKANEAPIAIKRIWIMSKRGENIPLTQYIDAIENHPGYFCAPVAKPY